MNAAGYEGFTLVSEQLTAVRRRLGRYWISPPGKGICLSFLLNPALQPEAIPKLTQIDTAAVCLALEENDPNAIDNLVKQFTSFYNQHTLIM